MDNEQAILGLLMMDNHTLMGKLRYGLRLEAVDLQNAVLFQELIVLDDEKASMTPPVVAQRTGISLDALNAMVEEAFSIGDDEAVSLARGMIQQADVQRAAHKLDMLKNELLNGKPLMQIQKEASIGLMQRRGQVLQDASLSGIHQRIEEKIARGEKLMVTSTGNPWFDACLKGGLRSKRFIAIGGRQKGRKTSILRNLLLGAASDKHWNPNMNVSIAFLCLENDQEITYYDMVCMIGMDLLVKRGIANKVISKGTTPSSNRLYQDRMDGETIQTAIENHQLENWPEDLRGAVHEAANLLDQLPIWIYDSIPENGGLENLTSVEMAIEMHAQTQVQPGQHYIIAADYAQLIEDSGKDYEDMKRLSKRGLWICQHYNATFLLASQMNEATNLMKSQVKKRVDYVGTKGGGSLEAAVQNYFVSTYDANKSDVLTVEQQRARRSPYMKQEFEIHPASGLILKGK